MAISDNLKEVLSNLPYLHCCRTAICMDMKFHSSYPTEAAVFTVFWKVRYTPSLYRLVEKGMISDHSEKVGKGVFVFTITWRSRAENILKTSKHEYILHTAGVLKILQVDNIEEIIAKWHRMKNNK